MGTCYLGSGSRLMSDTSYNLVVTNYMERSEVEELVERAIDRQTKQSRRSKWKSAIRRPRRKH